MTELSLQHPVKRGGTHLVGYLFNTDDHLSRYYCDRSLFDPTWGFEDIVARLITLGKRNGQDIFKQTDEEKCMFELEGTYKGEVFTLYDYKGNGGVNIGGTDRLDVIGLSNALADIIKVTLATKFKEHSPYTGEVFLYL